LYFHREQVLKSEEEDNISKIEFSEFKKILKSEGVDIESLKSWSKINELKLVADSVKHAEGRSSEELKKLRLDLFILA
jgi:hypothetical protein